MNRLNKTKVERVVDHEQEKVDRIKQESAIRRVAAAEKVCVNCLWGHTLTSLQKKADAELARAREAEKAARSYDTLFNVEEDEDAPRKTGRELEEDFM